MIGKRFVRIIAGMMWIREKKGNRGEVGVVPNKKNIYIRVEYYNYSKTH